MNALAHLAANGNKSYRLLWDRTLPPGRPLHVDNLPPHDPQDVMVAVYPQDPLVDRGNPIIMPFPASKMEYKGARLYNDHFETINKRSPHIIRPDDNGDFIFAPGTPQFCQVNAHVHATRTLQMVERYRGKAVPWTFGDERRQKVFVHVNHDRSGNSNTTFGPRMIYLDTYASRELGKDIRDAESADAIAHEVGHDILKGIRPNASEKDEETAGFHESFGDIVAILYAMEFPENRERALSQTGGNLRHQNIIAKLFEEDGKATRLKENPEAHGGFYLRSGINDKVYEKGKKMDEHDLSLPFTAGFYETLVGCYEKGVAAGKTPQDALVAARDRMGEVWAKSQDYLPRKKLTFAAGLSALLKANQELKAGVGDMLRESFARHGIRPLD